MYQLETKILFWTQEKSYKNLEHLELKGEEKKRGG